MHILNGVFSFFVFAHAILVVCCKLLMRSNMWCCICVSNVKVMNEPSFCFKVLDDLWQWQAWWGALVENFNKWVGDGNNKR